MASQFESNMEAALNFRNKEEEKKNQLQIEKSLATGATDLNAAQSENQRAAASMTPAHINLLGAQANQAQAQADMRPEQANMYQSHANYYNAEANSKNLETDTARPVAAALANAKVTNVNLLNQGLGLDNTNKGISTTIAQAGSQGRITEALKTGVDASLSLQKDGYEIQGQGASTVLKKTLGRLPAVVPPEQTPVDIEKQQDYGDSRNKLITNKKRIEFGGYSRLM